MSELKPQLEYTHYSGSPFMDCYQIHEVFNEGTDQEERIYLCDLWIPLEGENAQEEYYAVPLSAKIKFNHWELMEMFPQLPRIEYPRQHSVRIPALAAIAAQLLTLDRKEEVFLILNFITAYGTDEGELLLTKVMESIALPEEMFKF